MDRKPDCVCEPVPVEGQTHSPACVWKNHKRRSAYCPGYGHNQYEGEEDG